MKNNYVLILFAEKNIVSATSDMRKYIFKKKMFVLCLSRVSRVFFSVPVLVPCCSVSVVPAIVNLCLWKEIYFLILFAEKNIVSATSDMRKYIFQKKHARSVSFSCLSYFFSRYPFSSHGALLVSTHTVSRALRFLMFNVFSVLLLSFYLVLCLSRVSRVFFSVPVLVPGRSVSVVPAIVNLCLWKEIYFLILFAEKNIVSATSDMLQYIFPKKWS